MTNRDKALLDGVRMMAADAPRVGLCAKPFEVLCEEIERIIAERDALQEAQEWISVTDRLPKPKTEVMVAFDDGDVWCLWQNWKNRLKEDKDNPFEYAMDSEWEKWHTVTHWRPKPKAPGNEQGEKKWKK